MQLRVGFAGLGRMGWPMAANIARAGFELTAYNRTAAKAQEFADEFGAQVATTPRDMAGQTDVVVTMLADEAAVESVYGGQEGLVAGLRPDMVAVEMSTVGPEVVAGLAQRVRPAGASLVDAPVSGSTAAAEGAELTIMVGGASQDVDRVRGVLESMGRSVVHLGDGGAGASMKLAVNAVIYGLGLAVSEALDTLASTLYTPNNRLHKLDRIADAIDAPGLTPVLATGPRVNKESRVNKEWWVMPIRRIRVIATAAALAVALVACGSDSTTDFDQADAEPDASPANAGSEETGGEVGFSESFLTDNFQVQLVRQLDLQAEEQGVNLLPAVNADGDPAKQNADIATLLSRGVEGLIAVPIDSTAIIPAIEEANAAGVPVVTVDLGAAGGEIYMIVRADNVFMGRSACEVMGDRLGGQGTVLNLQGDLASANGQDRSQGFTDCMEEDFPDINVISRPMEWSAQLCTETTQTVLSTQEIDGIFMASDSVCLSGVVSVLRNQNKLVPVDEEGHIVAVSIDGTPESLDAIRDGTLDAVISQPLDLYGQFGIFYIKAAMAGETFEPGETDHGSTIIQDGASFADLLPSPTVTQENVDDPVLWGNG